MEAKSFADGWTSRLLQRTLAGMLVDPELRASLDHARDAYRHRRELAAEALNAVLRNYDGGTTCGPDGVNLWVNLPHWSMQPTSWRGAGGSLRGTRGSGRGIFFLRPGRNDVVRLNAGSVSPELAQRCGGLLAEAAVHTCKPQPKNANTLTDYRTSSARTQHFNSIPSSTVGLQPFQI
jgi:DNA-binding transcriptional MocR family regulator